MATIEQSHGAAGHPPFSQPQAGLLTIPPEIRNQIYQLALIGRHSRRSKTAFRPRSSPVEAVVVPAPISVHRSTSYHWEPPLLRTCKLVRDEALAVYFGCNIFEFSYARHVQPWVKVLGTTKASLLRMVLIGPVYNRTAKSDGKVKELLGVTYQSFGLSDRGLRAGVLVVNTGTYSEPRYINSLGEEVLATDEA
ncbi:hypothetical protein LTR10_012402 [Elasticomyces elasticus]|nr:hypothetical protein LTR10_012402 [Elasticomyces elasticus]KAK4965877.1 hypothetical protein LTR42_011891 [Elasticomyces elasticus]